MIDCCEGHRIVGRLSVLDVAGNVLGSISLNEDNILDILASLEEGDCLVCNGTILI